MTDWEVWKISNLNLESWHNPEYTSRRIPYCMPKKIAEQDVFFSVSVNFELPSGKKRDLPSLIGRDISLIRQQMGRAFTPYRNNRCISDRLRESYSLRSVYHQALWKLSTPNLLKIPSFLLPVTTVKILKYVLKIEICIEKYVSNSIFYIYLIFAALIHKSPLHCLCKSNFPTTEQHKKCS